MDVVSELLADVGYHWFWFSFATALLVIEALVGRFMMLAASVGALIVGALVGLYPYVGFSVQALFFVVIASILMWMTRSYLRERMAKASKLQDIVQNQRYVGREFQLVNPIEGGHGSVNIDGVVWHLQGGDTRAGSHVRVVGMSEGLLRVEPV